MPESINLWRNLSCDLIAKGTTVKKANSLADLHRRRDEAQGQFYTPDWVAAGMWSLVEPAMTQAFAETGYPVPVFDNSVGSGRLLQFASQDKHQLFGCDIDAECVDALSADAEAAGFRHDFVAGGMEEVTAKGFGVSIINPPFGLHLEHPQMKTYPSTCYGVFGPNTSAISHLYAIDQAMSAARVVVALLPTSARDECFSRRRLVAEIVLPDDTFKLEGANVRTAVYVFGPAKPVNGPLSLTVNNAGAWPTLNLTCETTATLTPKLTLGGVDLAEPVITTPVTHDNTVGLHHHGRRLRLKFSCGLTEARVMNGLLQQEVEDVRLEGRKKHRYPSTIKFEGDGRLLLDAYLLQEDPEAAFQDTVSLIRSLGGEPVVSDTLRGYWSKLIRKHQRAITPFRHTVKGSGVSDLKATAKRGMLMEQGNTKSPVIRKGEQISVMPLGGDYLIEKDGFTAQYRRDQLQTLFDLEGGSDERTGSDWQVVHEGLIARFPELAMNYRAQIQNAGINWLWPYQEDSLVELLIKRSGIAAWEQGTGKARLAIALAILSGRGLICVESGLVPEMVRELNKIKLDPDQWQVIKTAPDASTLRVVNIISYNRLKASAGVGNLTIAHRLRRRASFVIADEGGILSNPESQQSRALLRLCPRPLFCLDGTPIGNYPRDILPLAKAAVGGGVAHQPYDIRSGIFLEAKLFHSATGAKRGIDQFRNQHVVLEWATNEFSDNLRGGAKREIPRINNVVAFRDWTSAFLQRRLRHEPEVHPFAGCPRPVPVTRTIQWDADHLRHYLKPAVGFSEWFERYKREQGLEGKGLNFVAILARINAVIQAANQPHASDAGTDTRYHPLTSKQRYAIERLVKLAGEGKKTIVYATSPALLERLEQELAARGIEAVLFTGKDSIVNRTKRLDERFRFGPAPVLLASMGVSQKGLNLEQASHIIFFNRDWTGDAEAQAIARTLRPDQKAEVVVEYLHLAGSIDIYMAQVVSWKLAAADAGLDWGNGATESDVFMHMDSVFESFCHSTLGMSANDAYRHLIAA